LHHDFHLSRSPEGNLLTGMGQHLDGIMTVGDVRKALQEKQRAANITVLYFHCDHIGTPLALLDQRKKIVWAARRDPWGNLQEQYNPSGIIQPIGLPGQYYDRETGLYYNGHRYYDARIGAYINQDPIGLLGGLNLYGYVSNPLRFIDPLGLDGLPFDDVSSYNLSSATSNYIPPATNSTSLTCSKANCDCEAAYKTCKKLVPWYAPTWETAKLMISSPAELLTPLTVALTAQTPDELIGKVLDWINPIKNAETLSDGCDVGYKKCKSHYS
jgi:RHS repeat-associated protein